MVGAGGRRRWPRAGGVGFRTGPAMCRTPSTLIPVSRASLARSASAAVSASYRESFAGAETARAIRPIAGQPCLVHRCRTHGASHHQLPELRDSSLLRVSFNGRTVARRFPRAFARFPFHWVFGPDRAGCRVRLVRERVAATSSYRIAKPHGIYRNAISTMNV
jgi:hypothetical protein